jgi:nucleotide-binding universal stress UspA family protein
VRWRNEIETKEKAMYANVLIPTDGSELAGKAVAHGIALAKRIGARITVLTVSPPFHVFTANTQMIEDSEAGYKTRMQQQAEKTLSAVGDAAIAAGVACDTFSVENEHPYQAIIDTAASKGCDLIVMASHGRHGLSAIVLGSETVKVLTHCKIPVLVHR